MPDVEADVAEFMGNNSLELEFTASNTVTVPSIEEHLRVSTLIVLTPASNKEKQEEMAFTPIGDLLPAQKVLNVCSPFGMNAKELFMNITYKGIIVSRVSPRLYLTDLDGHLVNVEGSPVMDKKSKQLIGIRLPNVHSFNLFMGSSLFVTIDTVLRHISKKGVVERTLPVHNGLSFVDAVVKIKDGNLRYAYLFFILLSSSAVIID